MSAFSGRSGLATPTFWHRAHVGVNVGVNRSEVGLVICRSVVQKGEEIRGNPHALPLQFVAGNLKGYLKG
jgi:hypothetical protein